MSRAWASVALAIAVSACASAPTKEEQAVPDSAYELLLKSARQIQASLGLLAEAEQYEKLKERPGEPRIYRQIPGMEQVVTMPWHGPIEQAVSKLASFSGYAVKFVGRTPALPILVQIGREPATVSDHLRNVGLQAGNRAEVVVDPKQRLIEVRYGDGAI